MSVNEDKEEDTSLTIRNKGNELFKLGDFEGALKCYEKNYDCVISTSNAAEVCLRLDRYTQAEEFAKKALSLEKKNYSSSSSSSSSLFGSPVYQKSITRLVKSVVMQSRLAEGHVLVADSGLPVKARVTLHATACGSLSPHCQVFRDGLYLRKPLANSYGVYTSVALPQGELILIEKAVQPWSIRSLLNDDALSMFLQQTPETAFACLNGFYPRENDSIPMHIQSLQMLYGRIRTLLPGRSESEYDRYLRLLARIKLNCHSDGCHGFVTFFNHSCEPNCYVRDDRIPVHTLRQGGRIGQGGEEEDVIKICTLKPITENEELCISYLGPEELKQPALVRASIVYNSWGHSCQCTRCAREM